MMAQATLEDDLTRGSNVSVDLPETGGLVPVLLLPGTLCDARIFEQVAAAFTGHRVIDIPINGAELTTALARQILATAPPSFALVGFSLGGIVALEIAALAPDRVAGLALIATTARPDPTENAETRRKLVTDASKRGLTAHYLDQVWPGSTAPLRQHSATLRAIGVAMAEATTIASYAQQAEIAISRADSRPRLPRLTMPTLVLCGATDSVCPVDRHREIADAMPAAELVIVPDAGHLVLLEAPAEVAPHLARWLQILSTNTDTLPHRTMRQTKDFQ
jgi:pimeloyl-ACP methyl ester carboxylesterase